MKNQIFLLVAIVIFNATPNSHAAFPVKMSRQIVPQTKEAEYSTWHLSGKDSKAKIFPGAINNLLRSYKRSNSLPYDDNTNGTLSLVFALVGIIFPPFLIPAIVLGVVGLYNRERCALAGLITSVLIFIFYVSLIAIFLSAAAL